MATKFLTYAFILGAGLLSLSTQANDNEFIIEVGDVVSIQVYNEPELNIRAKLSSSGTVRVPLVGNVIVRGKTAQQVSQEIEAALLDGYLVEPSVTVIVDTVRPFYVRGAVINPSVYQFNLGMNVEQAIAVAGGLKDRASRSAWYVIRVGQEKRIKADKNFKIQPGDIIEIEESIF